MDLGKSEGQLVYGDKSGINFLSFKYKENSAMNVFRLGIEHGLVKQVPTSCGHPEAILEIFKICIVCTLASLMLIHVCVALTN